MTCAVFFFYECASTSVFIPCMYLCSNPAFGQGSELLESKEPHLLPVLLNMTAKTTYII